MSRSERDEIVRVHNEYRATIANGRERRGRPGPQPPAADMEMMVSSCSSSSSSSSSSSRQVGKMLYCDVKLIGGLRTLAVGSG